MVARSVRSGVSERVCARGGHVNGAVGALGWTRIANVARGETWISERGMTLNVDRSRPR